MVDKMLQKFLFESKVPNLIKPLITSRSNSISFGISIDEFQPFIQK